MKFFDVANSSLLFGLVMVGIVFILAQCIIFFKIGIRRANELGIDKKVIRDTIKSSTIFSIAPSLAVVVGLAVLATSLGVAWSWFRLSIQGSVTYELMAAEMASSTLGFKNLAEVCQGNAEPFGAIMFAMSVGIAGSMISDLLFLHRVDSLAAKLKRKGGEFSTVAIGVLFYSILIVFMVPMFGSGTVVVLTIATSAIATAIQGILISKFKMNWLSNFVLSFSLIIAMASSVLWTNIFS